MPAGAVAFSASAKPGDQRLFAAELSLPGTALRGKMAGYRGGGRKSAGKSRRLKERLEKG
jgi:hypothetical protein